MRELRTVQQVLKILGEGDPIAGRRRLCAMTGDLTQHVTNWINEGRFPAKHWLLISHALAQHGRAMHPSVCGQTPLPKERRAS